MFFGPFFFCLLLFLDVETCVKAEVITSLLEGGGFAVGFDGGSNRVLPHLHVSTKPLLKGEVSPVRVTERFFFLTFTFQ